MANFVVGAGWLTFSVWQGANIVNNEVSGGQLVNGTLRFTNDFSRLMFTPAARWQASTNYVVRLTRGIRDRSNVALPANVLSRFTTQACVHQRVGDSRHRSHEAERARGGQR